MVKHLFANFLQDQQVYFQAERYWVDLWDQLDPPIREEFGWIQPWFQPLTPAVSEGNPIFSAVSPKLRRGIRILQSEPTENEVEFYAYPDTFGGTIFDPAAIHELVISCALSDASAFLAKSLIRPWIAGRSIDFDINEIGMIAVNSRSGERFFGERQFPFAA